MAPRQELNRVQTLTILFVSSGLLLTALSIPLILRRVQPNPFYGFRVASTLADPAMWYAVNRYAGWRLGASGLVIAGTAILLARLPGLRLDGYAWACLAVVAITLGLTLAQSFARLRRLAAPVTRLADED